MVEYRVYQSNTRYMRNTPHREIDYEAVLQTLDDYFEELKKVFYE